MASPKGRGGAQPRARHGSGTRNPAGAYAAGGLDLFGDAVHTSGEGGLAWETRLWAQGFRHVAGVDEVGRGALAGPVVAAAVLIPPGACFSPLIRDSKQLSPKQRKAAWAEIQRVALSIGIGLVDAPGIERLNIRQATRLAMAQAVAALHPRPDFLLVDAERLETGIPQYALIGGDQASQAIAAASIVAKLARDSLAETWDARYPQYGFSRHKGYGTRSHRLAITAYGPCPLHRLTFLPAEARPGPVPVQQEFWPRGRNLEAL